MLLNSSSRIEPIKILASLIVVLILFADKPQDLAFLSYNLQTVWSTTAFNIDCLA